MVTTAQTAIAMVDTAHGFGSSGGKRRVNMHEDSVSSNTFLATVAVIVRSSVFGSRSGNAIGFNGSHNSNDESLAGFPRIQISLAVRAFLPSAVDAPDSTARHLLSQPALSNPTSPP